MQTKQREAYPGWLRILSILGVLLFHLAMAYVAIYHGEKKIITHLTLKMLQEKLPAHQFIQPHKSFLVSVNKINSIEGNILHAGKAQIPISKYQKEGLMEKIVNSKLLKR